MFRSIALAATLTITPVSSSVDYTRWPLLVNPFPSTSGGGVMIDDYRPVVTQDLCLTNFSVVVDGQRTQGIVGFDVVRTQGGVLCRNGRWSTLDGSAAGTTPFEVFIKDGVVRRAP